MFIKCEKDIYLTESYKITYQGVNFASQKLFQLTFVNKLFVDITQPLIIHIVLVHVVGKAYFYIINLFY